MTINKLKEKSTNIEEEDDNIFADALPTESDPESVSEDTSDDAFNDELDSLFGSPIFPFGYNECVEHSYGEYAGTYAQDVMGYDDDTINDVFEGDPDM
jgi:hypothetical protein